MRRYKVFLEQMPQNLSPEQVELHPRPRWRRPPGRGWWAGRSRSSWEHSFTWFLSQVLLNGSEDGSPCPSTLRRQRSHKSSDEAFGPYSINQAATPDPIPQKCLISLRASLPTDLVKVRIPPLCPQLFLPPKHMLRAHFPIVGPQKQNTTHTA